MLLAKLRVFVSLLCLIFASVLVAEQVRYGVFAYDLHYSTFIEDMEYFKLLLKM